MWPLDILLSPRSIFSLHEEFMKDLEERRLGLGSGYCCLEGFASNCCESPAGSRAEKDENIQGSSVEDG